MKAVLSNRIYMEVDREYGDFIKEDLTYRIPSYHDPDKPIVIRNFGIIRPGLMTLPIGRVDLIPEGYEILDKRIYVPEAFPEFQFTLRESQQIVHDEIDDNAIINAKPSWGKTFAGLKIAGKLGQKTLVVVHTVPLRNQWAAEVRKVYGFEPGIVGSSKFNISSPVVIGNVQSLYNCMEQIQKSFGTVILDEMHHVSSPTFSRVMDRSYARYKIGLSGTLKRKDGKDVVFRDYFGNKIFKPPPENAMQPEVDVIDSGISLPEVIGNNWAQRVNALMEMPEYRALVMRLADYYAIRGHKILVLQDRVEFAKTCAEHREKAVAITGDLKEGREEEMNRIFSDIDEIWGITSIFKEGISKDNLSCAILAGPINNDPMLEQIVGRIQRPYEGKQQPKIVDIKLAGWTGSKQFQARLGFYMRMGYKINYL
jgi:superfamily II DNA or RNA helicase